MYSLRDEDHAEDSAAPVSHTGSMRTYTVRQASGGEMKKRREIGSQQERSDATRAQLVAAARAAFATLGYAATSLDDVVDAAGVTKGALYSHFHSKQDPFRAGYAKVQEGLARAVTDAAAE